MPRKALALALAMSSVVVGCGTSASDGFPLYDVDEVRLPGPAVRFDYQDFDPAARRLMISHLAADEVLFVDVDRLDEISVVGDLPGVHGVRLAPDLGLAFASTSNNELATIDVESARVVRRSTTGSFPDGVAYDQASGLVVVSNKDDGSVTVIAADTGDVARTVAVGDEAGNSIDDPTTGHVFVASAGPESLVELDPATGTVVRRIALGGCEGAHGVYVTGDGALAFVACERNATLVTVDLRTGDAVDDQPVGSVPDVLAYDPGLQRLYVAAESGDVAVFQLEHGRLRSLGRRRLDPHAHSVAVDSKTHRVFLPLQDVDGHPVLRVMEP